MSTSSASLPSSSTASPTAASASSPLSSTSPPPSAASTPRPPTRDPHSHIYHTTYLLHPPGSTVTVTKTFTTTRETSYAVSTPGLNPTSAAAASPTPTPTPNPLKNVYLVYHKRRATFKDLHQLGLRLGAVRSPTLPRPTHTDPPQLLKVFARLEHANKYAIQVYREVLEAEGVMSWRAEGGGWQGTQAEGGGGAAEVDARWTPPPHRSFLGEVEFGDHVEFFTVVQKDVEYEEVLDSVVGNFV